MHLARYTHRIAISNSRITGVTDDDKVLISLSGQETWVCEKDCRF
jgi:hypothetical protein